MEFHEHDSGIPLRAIRGLEPLRDYLSQENISRSY
jgi:hypothetical protein